KTDSLVTIKNPQNKQNKGASFEGSSNMELLSAYLRRCASFFIHPNHKSVHKHLQSVDRPQPDATTGKCVVSEYPTQRPRLLLWIAEHLYLVTESIAFSMKMDPERIIWLLDIDHYRI